MLAWIERRGIMEVWDRLIALDGVFLSDAFPFWKVLFHSEVDHQPL